MDATTRMLLLLGLMFLVGVWADTLGRRTPLPRVTLLILAGVLVGPSGVGWMDPFGTTWFEVLSQVALTMIGFMLGGHLGPGTLRQHGRDVLGVSFIIVSASVVLVGVAVWLVTHDAALALLLGGLSTATAPAATTDVVREVNGRGPFSDLLLGIVAVDDAWGIAVFSICMAGAAAIGGGDLVGALQAGSWEVVGAVLLGIAIGLPVAWITGRLSPGEPTLVHALGIVFLCLGAARLLHVSFLLAAVVLGAVVANRARHHERPFQQIAFLEWPTLVVFFVLAGAALHLSALPALGIAGGAYIVARIAGRLIGGYAGARARRLSPVAKRYLGAALLPQAGVAIGMALLGAQRFPHLADVLLPIVLASTVIFEVVGPPFTRLGVVKAGEANMG